jgi:hypothetical protein
MRNLLFIISVFASSYVKAANEIEYFTYGGFETIVDGFKRIGLMYSNSSFYAIMFCLVVLGVLFSVLKQIFGNVQTISAGSGDLKTLNPLTSFVPALIGVVLIKGLVMPTTDIYISDKLKNDFEVVAGVPTLIAYIAGGLNLVERIYIEDIVDSGSAFPYEKNANGISFKLLYDAIDSTSSFIDSYDLINLKKYYEDCGIHSLGTNSNNVTIEKLKSNTDDLSSVLADMKSASIYTTMYSGTNKMGSVYSCTDAYNNVIKNFVNDRASQDEAIKTICQKNGYDTSTMTQLQQCRTTLEGVINLIYKTDSTVDVNTYIRNAMISNAITEQITDDNPDGAVRSLANQSMIANGLSTAIGSQEWYSSLKSMLTVIILGITPILILLCVTPLITKAFPLMLSLFGFGTLWSLIDASMYQATLDSMTRTMQDITMHQMGLNAFWLTPTSSVKAMTVLSDARSSALSIAAMLASALFGLSAYGMSSVGQSTLGKVEEASNQAANDVTNPVNSAMYLDQVSNSQSISDNVAKSGMEGLTAAKSYDLASEISSTKASINAQGSTSAIDAGSNVGAVEGTESGAKARTHSDTGNLAASVDAMASTQTQKAIGESDGASKAAADENTSVEQMSQHSAYHGARSELAEIKGKEKSAEELGVDMYQSIEERATNKDIIDYGDSMSTRQNVDLIKSAYTTGDQEGDLRRATMKAAVLGDMGVRDSIIASQGDVDRITEKETANITKELMSFEGEEYVRNNEGVSLEQQAFYEGVSNAQKEASDLKVFQEKGYGAMLQAAEFESFNNANNNIAGSIVANENGGIDKATFLNSEVRHSEEMAHSEILNNTSAAMGISNQELAGSRDIAQNNQISINKEQADDLYDRGIITPEQYTSFAENDGGTLHGNFIVEKETKDLPVGLEVGLGMIGLTPEKEENGTWSVNNVSADEASYLLNQDLISEEEYKSIASGESNSLSIETGFYDKINISDSKASSGASTNIDNSFSDNQSNEINKDNIYSEKQIHDTSYTSNDTVTVTGGIDTGNQTSSIEVVTDSDKLFEIISNVDGDDVEKSRFAAIESSRALDGIYSKDDNISSSESLDGGLSVDAGKGGAFGIGGGYNLSSSEIETTNRDSVYNTMAGAYLDIASEADNLGLDGQDKDEWVSRKYADLNNIILEKEDKVGKQLAQSEELDQTISMYFEDNNFSNAKYTNEVKNDFGDLAKGGL